MASMSINEAFKNKEDFKRYLKAYEDRMMDMGPKERIGYMCKTDFDHHLEEDGNPQFVYPDLEELYLGRPCVLRGNCVAVRVKITIEEVIQNEQGKP